MTWHARRKSQALRPLQGTAADSSAMPKTQPRARRIIRILMMLMMVFALTTAAPREQQAQACGDYCFCEMAFHAILRSALTFESIATAAYITAQFIAHREIFWDEWMWGYNIGNALMMWTQELTTAAMTETYAIGAFFDAKHQLETQALLQTKMADAYRDYKPDVGMCTIGTIARGLGQTSRSGELVAHTIVENQIDRLTNTRGASGASGDSGDKDARIRLLRSRFCDARDAAGLMGRSLCNPATAVAGRNRDVDFNMTVMEPLTIDVDFADNNRTGPEEDVMGLSANLYAHKVLSPFPDHLLNDARGRSYMLDQRAIAAKRSVASYSFGSIVGMKAAGSAASAGNAQYLRAVLEQLGAPQADTETYIGARPSYYAQMEMLTKKIYQDPEFYTNLYDAPANVERKSAAIRAVRMVQDMDKFNSVLRSEQSLSVLLELYLEDMQKDIVNTDGAVGE
jgi:hypothetical protein